MEIFSKSKFAFHDLRCSEPDSGCGAGEQPSSLETTACFFAGVVLVIMLDFLVHFMQSWAAKKDAAQTDTARDPLLGVCVCADVADLNLKRNPQNLRITATTTTARSTTRTAQARPPPPIRQATRTASARA